LGKRFLEALF